VSDFERVLNKYGARGLGYAIFSMIVEREPLVIIVNNDEDIELLTFILEEVRDRYEIRKTPTSKYKLANFEIIKKEDYYKNWRAFSGKRLIFIEEDKNLFCPGLDLLERIIEEVVLSKTRDPIGRIAMRVSDVLTSLELAKDYYMQYLEKKIDEKKLMSLLQARFPKKEEADLILEIIKSLFMLSVKSTKE